MNPDSVMAFITFGHEWLAVIVFGGMFAIGWEAMHVAHEWCMARGRSSNGAHVVAGMAGVAFVLLCLALSSVVHFVIWALS